MFIFLGIPIVDLDFQVKIKVNMSMERKNNASYRFPRIYTSSLLQMSQRSPLDNKVTFKKEFGRITGFLGASLLDYQEKAIHTLLQFYDPPLRCFTFPDYQLAPTLEEYSNLLDITIKHQMPFHTTMESLDSKQIAAVLCLSKSDVEANLKTKSGLRGFQLDFLIKKAHLAANKEMWDVFNVLLACCIYGIVLFPNVVNFIDMNAIRIFCSEESDTYTVGRLLSLHTY